MDEKLRCVAAGLLSGKSSYTLLVNGAYGTREINNLIRQLEMYREFFTASDLPPPTPHDSD